MSYSLTLANFLSTPHRTLGVNPSKNVPIQPVAITLDDGTVIPENVVRAYVASSQEAYDMLDQMTTSQLFDVASFLNTIQDHYYEFVSKLCAAQVPPLVVPSASSSKRPR